MYPQTYTYEYSTETASPLKFSTSQTLKHRLWGSLTLQYDYIVTNVAYNSYNRVQGLRVFRKCGYNRHMPEDTYSVSQVARSIGISPNTVRSWTATYSKYLSTHNRPDDDERRYTADDVTLLQTVKVLRDQRESHKLIIPRIAADERLEPPPEAKESPLERKTEDADSALMTEREARLIRDFGRLEGEFIAVKHERDRLRVQLNMSQDRLQESHQTVLDSETRAVVAETRLETIYRRHWWQLWRPERPQEAD